MGGIHEVDPLTAKLIFLSLMSGIVDPRIKVGIPSMGFFPLTLPIVIADLNPQLQRAVRYASSLFTGSLAFMTDDLLGKSPGARDKHVVQRQDIAKSHHAQCKALKKELDETTDPCLRSEIQTKLDEVAGAILFAVRELEKALLGCRPGVLVNQLSADSALEPHLHAYDGKVFSLSPGGEAVQDFLLSSPKEKALILSYLLSGYFGGSWTWEHYRNKESQVGCLWLASRADVDLLLDAVGKQSPSMLSNLVVCFPEDKFVQSASPEGGLQDLGWLDFIDQHLELRLLPEETPLIIQWSPEAFFLFKKLCKAYRDKSINFLPFQRNICLAVPELLGKISALLQLSAPPFRQGTITESAFQEAAKIVEAIVDQRLAYHGQAHQEAEDREFQAIVERIMDRGPIKKRDLLRSFHRPDARKIDKMLKRAEEKGIIKIVDRKLQVESNVGAVGGSAG